MGRISHLILFVASLIKACLSQCTNEVCVSGVCSEINGDVSCNCDGTGFKGKFCNVDINECTETVAAVCDAGQTCKNRVGTYVCVAASASENEGLDGILNEASSAADSNVGLYFIIGGVAIVVASIVAYVIYRNNRRRRRVPVDRGSLTSLGSSVGSRSADTISVRSGVSRTDSYGWV